MGVVLLTPFLLLITTVPRPFAVFSRRRVEAGALFLVLGIVAAAAFTSRFPIPYLIFPPVVWAALRFSRLGAATAVLVVTGVSVAATVRGGGPYVASLTQTQSLIALQAFNGCVSLVALVLATSTDQAARARSALEELTANLETQVEARTAELRAVSQAKTEYLSRMSHELRTPLAAIVGYADLLLMDETREQQRGGLEAIVSASDHLIALINDVLDISRIESGKAELLITPVPVADVVEASVDLVAKAADARHIRIDTASISGVSTRVSADRAFLTQALVNLLSNAVKYTPPGGLVTASVEPVNGDRTRVVISDTGPGIPKELLPRAFEPFDRLGAERTDTTGTGLGLALCRGVVESMGGSVGVTSEVGSGSSFWLELSTARAIDASPPTTHGTESPAQAAQRSELTVLFVEDNATTAQMMMQVFARRPHVRVIPATLGRVALDLAAREIPDAVLLDLHLPDMTGLEVLDQLKSDPSTARIPVIVISADATTATIGRLLQAGAHSYITKPIRPRTVLTIIDGLIEVR
jgi:signal transduction histidine kinase/CheY-like chemotaxis protein